MKTASATIGTLIVLRVPGLAAQEYKSANQTISASAAIFFTECGQ